MTLYFKKYFKTLFFVIFLVSDAGAADPVWTTKTWTHPSSGRVYKLGTKEYPQVTYAALTADLALMPWYGSSSQAQSCSQAWAPGGAGVVFGQPSKACIFDLYTISGGVQEGGGSAWNWYLHPMTFQLTNGASGMNLGWQYSGTFVVATPMGPPSPSITDLTDATNSGSLSDTVTSFTAPVIYGSAQANTAVNIYVAGVKIGSTTSNGSGAWSYTMPSQTNGIVNITATAEDSNGESPQTSNFPITVDTVLPSIGPITLDNASNSGLTTDLITNQNRPTLNGAAEAGSTVSIYKDGSLVGTTVANGSGNWSLTLTSSLIDGPHSFTADATDAAANSSVRTAALVVKVDTHVASPTGSLSTGNITNNTRPVLTGVDAEPYAQVEIFLDGTRVTTVQADASGHWSYQFAAPISEGPHDITLKQVDVAGNISSLSSVMSAVVDLTPPNVPVITGLSSSSSTGIVDNDLTSQKRPTIVGTAEPSSTVKIYKSGVYVGQTVVNSSGDWTYTFPTDLADGLSNITAGSTDRAGNSSVVSQAYALKVDTALPTVEVIGPSEVQTGPFAVTVKFNEPVWNFDSGDITITNGAVTRVEGGPSEYIAYINPVMGKYVHINVAANVAMDGARNLNSLSNEYSVLAGSPASEFEKYSAEIRQVLISEAERELRTTVGVNKRMVQNARDRMIQADQAFEACLKDLDEDPKLIDDCHKKHRNVSFGVNGTASMDNTRVQTQPQPQSVQGQFFGLKANEQEQTREIIWGDFTVLRERVGSQTATLSARWVREHDVSERAMLSYFVGGNFASSDIGSTTFKGDNQRVGLTVGLSGLYRINKGLYLNGFASYVQGRNDLAMANEVLSLSSNYTTRSTALGGALTGVIDYQSLQFRPELSWSYGQNKIGEVGFAGRAYGLTDNTLRMNAGQVTVSDVLFRPELRVPTSVGNSNKGIVRFSPRLLCEKVSAIKVTDHCGSGGELGLEILSINEQTKMNLDWIYDKLGNTSRRTFKLGVDHRF